MPPAKIEQATFLLLLLTVSLAFIGVLMPFFGAIFWALVIAIIFWPMHRGLVTRLNGRENLAALLVLLVCVIIVIAPVLFFFFMLVQEAASFYQRAEAGDIDLEQYVDRVRDAFPFVKDLLHRFGIDLDNLGERFSDGAMAASQFLGKQALNIGQNTVMFVVSFVLMLYLVFFMLRDGERLMQRVIRAVPMREERERLLLAKFAEVARATVKGNLVIAALQGALGGLIFWILGIQGAVFWGVIMAILSLLPAVGAALVWGPVAIYLFATGSIAAGIVLVLFGALVIGLLDNLLRPILVGRDTKLPDYIVLLSTLGGLSVFGINGFVIGPLIAAMFVAVWDIFSREVNIDESLAPEALLSADDTESGSN